MLIGKSIRAAAIFALIMGTGTLLAWAWTPRHFIADAKPPVTLETLVPREFAGWKIDPTIVPLKPSPDQQRVIDETYDQVLARTYRNEDGQRIMLSLAYGRNQHEGMNTHRPEVCYPAQGFNITQSPRRGNVPFGKATIDVTRLVATQGGRTEPITYWLMVGNEVTHFGRDHKIVTLTYGLRGDIPDGIFVRVSSIDIAPEHAFGMHERFIRDMLSEMNREQLLRVLGRAADAV